MEMNTRFACPELVQQIEQVNVAWKNLYFKTIDEKLRINS